MNDLWGRGRRAREINDQEVSFGYRNVLKLDHGDGHKFCKYPKILYEILYCMFMYYFIHSVNIYSVAIMCKA